MRNAIAYPYSRCQRGLTLVELIVSMVIISVALGGVLVVMNFTTRHSADPVIQHQAVAIAEAYMEEIALLPYSDPAGGYTGLTRALYDDVASYDGLTNFGATDQNGVAIAGLESYAVTVSVGLPAQYGPTGETVLARKITVRVQRGVDVDLTLTSYRTNYD